MISRKMKKMFDNTGNFSSLIKFRTKNKLQLILYETTYEPILNLVRFETLLKKTGNL
jgi:hypothetical protein